MVDGSCGRAYKPKTKKIMRDFVNSGASSVELAEKYGIHPKTASKICARSLATLDIGNAPDKCRQGVYANFKTIIEPFLRMYGVTWPQIMGPSRVYRIVRCRWDCWTALNNVGKPYLRIAAFFDKDHTTILNGCKKVRANTIPYAGMMDENAEKTNGSRPAAKRSQTGLGESSRAA